MSARGARASGPAGRRTCSGWPAACEHGGWAAGLGCPALARQLDGLRHEPRKPCRVDLFAELPPGPAPGTVIPVGITKDGQDPVVLEDSEYPEWLFRVGAEESETTEEMLSKGVKNLSYLDSAKLFRMLRRDKIKQHNSTNRKVA